MELRRGKDKALVTHLWSVCVHLEKTLEQTGCRGNWRLSVSSLSFALEMPPRPGGVCDRPSPGELASMMNGHLSTLYRPTKSCAYHAFMTNFCCFVLLPPFFE